MKPEALQSWVALAALACGLLSFGMFFVGVLRAQRSNAQERSERVNKALAVAPGASVDQVTDLVKALSSLTGSLAKAGPALWALVGSVLFLLIAAVSTGILHDAPVAAKPHVVSAAVGGKSGDPLFETQSNGVDEENLPVR